MYVSDWYPVSLLRPIEKDISSAAYTREFIEANRLNEKKSREWSSEVPFFRICFYEPLEVRKEGGQILWRENDDLKHANEPEYFETQLGTFKNYNHGEFSSWIELPDARQPAAKASSWAPSRRNRKINRIEGNFCDVFDCGPYVIAISNMMHMGLGAFKVIRIDRDIDPVTIYDNGIGDGILRSSGTRLEYFGRYRVEDGYVLIVSGNTWTMKEHDGLQFTHNLTYLFHIGDEGSCTVDKRWNIVLPTANSIVVQDGYAWFGNNKMVSCLNLTSGDLKYYTNKTNEEMAGLYKEKDK